MNIKLSVYTNRVKGKSGYVVFIDGRGRSTEVSGMVSINIKEDILTKLAKGLRQCRQYVSHKDILYIEIQNQHLCNWLNGKVEYKSYNTYLDEVFEVLESLDCRYKFVFVKEPVMKRLIHSEVTSSPNSSLIDALKELEK